MDYVDMMIYLAFHIIKTYKSKYQYISINNEGTSRRTPSLYITAEFKYTETYTETKTQVHDCTIFEVTKLWTL